MSQRGVINGVDIYGPVRAVKAHSSGTRLGQMQSYIRLVREGRLKPSSPDEICASPPDQLSGLAKPLSTTGSGEAGLTYCVLISITPCLVRHVLALTLSRLRTSACEALARSSCWPCEGMGPPGLSPALIPAAPASLTHFSRVLHHLARVDCAAHERPVGGIFRPCPSNRPVDDSAAPRQSAHFYWPPPLPSGFCHDVRPTRVSTDGDGPFSSRPTARLPAPHAPGAGVWSNRLVY